MNTETTISTRLKQLEEIIQDGLKTIVNSQFKVGAALIEIRDKTLYMDTHPTFEKYCREQWDMGKSRAYQLIAAAQIENHLSTIVDIKPTHESQVRPLAGLGPCMQSEVYHVAVKNANGKAPTARQVEEAKTIVMNRVPDRKPPIEQPEPSSLNEDIKTEVYHVFETSQKAMKRFSTAQQQRKFKAKLVQYLG